MKRISSKATVYLIDGSNFSRSFWSGRSGGSPDALEAEFLNWLDAVSRLGIMSPSHFRVVFDGGYRAVRGAPTPAINLYFSEHESADDFLLEHSYFLSGEGARCVIVTNDREIREKAAREKVMSMPCDAFYSLCEAELGKESR